MTDTEYRIEHDTMGEVRVPKQAKYQAQTQRAVENFPISGRPIGEIPELVRALAAIKQAAAIAKRFLGGAGLQPPKVFVGEFVLCHVMLLCRLRSSPLAVRLAVRFGADKGRSPLMRREQRSWAKSLRMNRKSLVDGCA